MALGAAPPLPITAMAMLSERRRAAACMIAATTAAAVVAASATAAVAAAAAAPVPPPPAPDFVIVGGGTAGCALAARLCAGLPRANVVLLERGAPRNETEELIVRAPLRTAAAWRTPTLTAAFPSAPNAGLRGRAVTLLTGATLGGSSAINGAQWSEPAAGGGGAGTWGVAGLTAANAAVYYARAARTVGAVVPPRRRRPAYTDAWLDAAAAAGLPRVDGSPGVAPPPDRGSWVHPLAVTPDGRRADACAAYVAPALAGACAANLRVLQGVSVTKLLYPPARCGGGRRCRRPTAVAGIEYMPSPGAGAPTKAGDARVLYARRGVLVAAGPYGSAPLLHRSGIGPAAALRSAGIPPLVDLPVGEGISARASGTVMGRYSGVPLARVNNATAAALPAVLAQWRAGRGGLLATAPTSGLSRWTAGAGGYTSVSFSALATPPGAPLFFATCIPNPRSVGRLRVAAANTSLAAPPVVETNLLGDPRDVATLGACMRQQQAVVAAFRPGFGMVAVAPTRGGTPFTDDAVQAAALSGLHIVGGAAVGPVLDARLRVKGFRNLWVVDASAVPTMPRSAGPMSSVYALAEFAAEAIVRQYGGVFGGGRG